MSKVWLRVALVNLFIAAIMGAILRYAFVEELPWLKFRYFLHGHSHTAMLGWVYLAIYALLAGSFLPEEKQGVAFYRDIFLLSQVAVIGMLIAFPLQGYGGWAIAFSSVHTLLSYFFAYRFWKDIRRRNGFSVLFAKAALLFMLFSTVALWGMAPIMVFGYQNKAIYHMAIQFYLHFQFNGWFTFAVLALFFRLLESRNIEVPPGAARYFFWLLAVSSFFTYALAVAWAEPLPMVFAANSLGVSLQGAAALFFVFLIYSIHGPLHRQLGGWGFFLVKLAFACFALKVLMQAAVVIPYIATVAYTIRNFVIGFIHLVLLGVITMFLLGFSALKGYLKLEPAVARAGLLLLLAGFIGSEALLFLQGTLFWGAMGFLPFYYEALFGISLLMPVGVGVLLSVNTIMYLTEIRHRSNQ